MYPIIEPEYHLKGCRDNFFLFSIKTFEEFPVNNLQAEILAACSGEMNVNDLQLKFKLKGVSQTALRSFLATIRKSGFIQFSKNQEKVRPDINSELLKVKAPYLEEVHLDLTKNCNLRCLYCYQEPYIGKNLIGPELSFSELRALIDELAQMNVAKLVISGGEPFLISFLPEIIEYANRKGIAVPTLFTNGTIFGKNIEYVKERRKEITLAISLDGHNEDVHGYSRGKLTFEKVIDFIESDSGIHGNKDIKIVIDTIITPANYAHLKEMYLFFGGLKNAYRWRVSVPREQGCFLENRKTLELNLDLVLAEYKKFIEWYVAEGQSIFPKMSVQIESIFRSTILQGEKMRSFSKDTNCCEYKLNALTIKPNGDVTTCTAFTSLVIGNIRELPISSIWKSKKMQSIKQLKISKIKDCQDCPELYLCGSGCRKVAADGNGFFSKDETACKIYKFFNAEIIPIFTELGLSPFE